MGFSIARKMLSRFTQQDWKKLFNNVSDKSLEYQRKLAYCIENSGNEYELGILLSMVNTNDEELFEICVDSLREFIGTDNKQLILKNDILINQINRLLPSSSRPTSKMYEDFLKKLSD